MEAVGIKSFPEEETFVGDFTFEYNANIFACKQSDFHDQDSACSVVFAFARIFLISVHVIGRCSIGNKKCLSCLSLALGAIHEQGTAGLHRVYMSNC